MIDKIAEQMAEKTRDNPLAVHMNAVGLIRLGSNNVERLENFNFLLNAVEQNGGNIVIPTYSYSYTKKEEYDLLNTQSAIGKVSEFIRTRNPEKRTVDALFSYVCFGKSISNRHFCIGDYSSFGRGSLIEEVFDKDGYIGSIGGVFSYLTEIHYLERMIGVEYRFDKIFEGHIIDRNGNRHRQTIEFYCRDLDYDLMVDFTKLERDLKAEGLIEVWNIKDADLEIEIEALKMRTVCEYIKKKLAGNKFYLCKRINN